MVFVLSNAVVSCGAQVFAYRGVEHLEEPILVGEVVEVLVGSVLERAEDFTAAPRGPRAVQRNRRVQEHAPIACVGERVPGSIPAAMPPIRLN